MSHGIVARYEHRRGHGNERKPLRRESEGRQCATMSPGACSSALRWYIQRTESPLHRAVRHCVGTFNVRNHRFTVDLSGARPRRWKSEFLSIPVHERQRLVINRMLNGFEGFLSTSKYAKLAKCSTDTALRDIRELLQRGILVQNSSGGRSTSYRLGDPDDVRD